MSYGLEISNSNNVTVITNDNTIISKEIPVDNNSGTLLANSSVEYTFSGAGNPALVGVNFTEGNAPTPQDYNNGLVIERNLQADKLIVKNNTDASKPYELQFFRFG
jgi:hypothetical protein